MQRFSFSPRFSFFGRLALLTPCFALPLAAQGRFCIGGDLDHLPAAQRTACSAKLAAVRGAAQRFGAPGDWHFVLVCGEEGWKDYVAFVARGDGSLERASADTDLSSHSTYLREDRLHAGEPNALERVVAREIATIVLKTADEIAIATQVTAWLGDGAQPTLQASR